MVGFGFDKTYQRYVYLSMDLMFILKSLNSVYDMLFMLDFRVEMEAYALEIWNVPTLGMYF